MLKENKLGLAIMSNYRKMRKKKENSEKGGHTTVLKGTYLSCWTGHIFYHFKHTAENNVIKIKRCASNFVLFKFGQLQL